MIFLIIMSSIIFKVFDITNLEPIEDAIIYSGKNIYFTDKNGLAEVKKVEGKDEWCFTHLFFNFKISS